MPTLSVSDRKVTNSFWKRARLPRLFLLFAVHFAFCSTDYAYRTTFVWFVQQGFVCRCCGG